LLEVAKISGDEERVVGERDRRDFEVLRAYSNSAAAEQIEFIGCQPIEWQNDPF